MHFLLLAALGGLAVVVNGAPTLSPEIDSGALLYERDSCTGYFAYGPLANNEHCKGIVDAQNAMAAINGVCNLYGTCNAGSGVYPHGSYKAGNVTASLKWGPKCSNADNQPANVTPDECVNSFFNFYFAHEGDDPRFGNGVCALNTNQDGNYVGGNIHWCDGSVFKLF